MKSGLLIVAVILLALSTDASAAKPIMNMIDVPIPIKVDGAPHSVGEVRSIIIEGCLARRWSPVIDSENVIRATLNVKNKHFAEVEILYTTSAYSIIHVSSDNLDYNDERQRIHRNYNKWVLKLSETIDQYLRRPAVEIEAKEGPATDNDRIDIYAEILKLDDLRNRGLLTDEEFESEKRKLLSLN